MAILVMCKQSILPLHLVSLAGMEHDTRNTGKCGETLHTRFGGTYRRLSKLLRIARANGNGTSGSVRGGTSIEGGSKVINTPTHDRSNGGRNQHHPTSEKHGRRVLINSIANRVKSMSYLPKWLILASVIGIISGLGAVVFYWTLTLATHFFLGLLAGYNVATPAGEGNLSGSAHYMRAWAIPLVVVTGGLLSGFIVFTWAPEAEGHGTDAAIDAVHHNPRGIRLRAVAVKIIASAITIGSGWFGRTGRADSTDKRWLRVLDGSNT